MSYCYDCTYFRPSEGKCGYKGYSRSASSECGIGEHKTSGGNCCGNCRYFRVEARACMKTGSSHEPWDSCGIYEHSRA